MSKQMRKKHPSSFKAQVAVEALKGFKTLAEISSEYKIHSNQISQWKKKLLEGIPSIFSSKVTEKEKAVEDCNELYEQIGRLKVELDWLKKKSNFLT